MLRHYLAYVWTPVGGLVLASAAVNAVLWLLVWRFFPIHDPVAVLHYSIDIGIDFIGEGKHVMTLPLIGSLLLVFNTVVGAALTRAERRASWVLWGVVPVTQVVLLLAFLVLWRANL